MLLCEIIQNRLLLAADMKTFEKLKTKQLSRVIWRKAASPSHTTFNWPAHDFPQKCPIPWRWSGLHLIAGSLRAHESTANSTLDRFNRFCRARPCTKHTTHATLYVCSNRPCLCDACDAVEWHWLQKWRRSKNGKTKKNMLDSRQQKSSLVAIFCRIHGRPVTEIENSVPEL